MPTKYKSQTKNDFTRPGRRLWRTSVALTCLKRLPKLKPTKNVLVDGGDGCLISNIRSLQGIQAIPSTDLFGNALAIATLKTFGS
ncbi:unnamed protein product [Mucor circinelloides]